MELVNCIICNSGKFSTYLKINDGSNAANVFDLVKCRCGLILLNPRPDSIEISKYYDKTYLPHLGQKKTLFNRIYRFVQKLTFKWKINILKRHSGDFYNVLDIGGGSGTFCTYLK